MQVPTGGVKQFLNDYTLWDLGSSKTRDKICQQCDESNKAVSYCKTCSDYFCDSCLKAHKRLKLFRDHTTVELESTQGFKCFLHPYEQMNIYCQTCKTLVCADCFGTSHNGHIKRSVDDRLQERAEKAIANSIHQVQLKQREFEENLDYLQSIEKSKTSELIQLKDKIDKKVDLMIVRLEARRTELHTKVGNTYTADLEKLVVEREYHERSVSNMKGALCFAKRVLDHKNDAPLLALAGQTISCLNKQSQLEWDSKQAEKLDVNKLEWVESTKIIVSRSNVRLDERTRYICNIELVGHIQEYTPSNIQLALQNVPKEVKRGQQAGFQVTVVAIEPQVHARVFKSIQMQGFIKNKMSPFALRSTVVTEPKDFGKVWDVRFTPRYSGTYFIELRVWVEYGGKTIGCTLTPNTVTPEIQVLPTDNKQ